MKERFVLMSFNWWSLWSTLSMPAFISTNSLFSFFFIISFEMWVAMWTLFDIISNFFTSLQRTLLSMLLLFQSDKSLKNRKTWKWTRKGSRTRHALSSARNHKFSFPRFSYGGELFNLLVSSPSPPSSSECQRTRWIYVVGVVGMLCLSRRCTCARLK